MSVFSHSRDNFKIAVESVERNQEVEVERPLPGAGGAPVVSSFLFQISLLLFERKEKKSLVTFDPSMEL